MRVHPRVSIAPRIALLACVKNGNRYLREFLGHYEKQGVDTVVFIDNNRIDGEFVQDAVDASGTTVDVRVVDRRGKAYRQEEWLTEEYAKLNGEFDWACIFDIDEFLFFRDSGETLKTYLADPVFDGYDMIRIKWVLYGDCGMVACGDDPSVVSRFKTPISRDKPEYKYNDETKSILRVTDRIRTLNAHGTRDPVKVCDCNGAKSYNSGSFMLPTKVPNPRAWLNHYRTKTLEEFVRDKFHEDYTSPAYKSCTLEMFFGMNDWTEEKAAFLRERGIDFRPRRFST